MPRQSTPTQQLSAWRILIRLIRFQRPYTWQTLLSIVLGFCTVGASVGLMATSGLLISKAALHPETILLIWVPIVGVRFFGLSRAAFRYGERYVSHDLTFRILKEIRVWLYKHLEPLVPLLWRRRRSGDVLASLTEDIDVLQNLYVRGLAPVVVAFLIMLLTAGILFTLAPWAAGWFVVMYVLAGVMVPWLALWMGRRPGEDSVQTRSRLYFKIQDALEGMPDAVGYGLEDRIMEDIRNQQSELDGQQRRLANAEGVTSALTLGFHQLAMLGVLWLGVLQVTSGRLSGVYLATMMLAALSAFEAILPLSAAFQQLGECVAAGRRILELAELPPAVAEPEAPDIPKNAALEVDNVSFAYPGQQTEALSNISFDLPQGKHVAIVGATGAGKSTLINLLVRLWAPTSGQVHLGGVNLQEVAQEEVEKWFAVVSQSAYLFHDTVRANIGLGKSGASSREIERAAAQAGIDQLIASLPEGYETQVGEFGTRFSGGERQRLALARALLKDAPVLLLDEPTAGLDSLTARRFNELLHQNGRGKSVVYITHQIVDMQYFDEILVLQQGHVAERGTHEELLSQRGLYRGMWEVYRDRLDVDFALGE